MSVAAATFRHVADDRPPLWRFSRPIRLTGDRPRRPPAERMRSAHDTPPDSLTAALPSRERRSPALALADGSGAAVLAGTGREDTHRPSAGPGSPVVGPHSKDAHSALLLVDESVLDVDPAGAHPGQVPDEALVAGRSGERVFLEQVDERLGFRLEPARGELLRVLRGLLRENDAPHGYHCTSTTASSRSSRAAAFKLSAIPGTPCRYRVS